MTDYSPRERRMFAALAVILEETGSWRAPMEKGQARAKLGTINRVAFEAIRDTLPGRIEGEPQC